MNEEFWTTFAYTYFPLIALFIAWNITIKGLALYRAASLRQKGWFVVFMVLNTAGILELIYLLLISKDKKATKQQPA